MTPESEVNRGRQKTHKLRQPKSRIYLFLFKMQAQIPHSMKALYKTGKKNVCETQQKAEHRRRKLGPLEKKL